MSSGCSSAHPSTIWTGITSCGITTDVIKQSNLTVKGQVTIPKDVRDALGLKPGEPVEIDWQGGTEALIRKPIRNEKADIEAYKARVREVSRRFAHLREGRPTDEIMREIRGDDPFPP